jgi:prevent-host-death family protein
MDVVVSATEARIHFGEIMRRVVETGTPITIERDGKPQVVIVSKAAYDDMRNGHDKPDWRALLDKAHAQIRADLNGRTLPPPEDIIRDMREERDAQLMGLP